MSVTLNECKLFFVRKNLAKDREVAEKLIFNFLGKLEIIGFSDFYKLFSRGIFRISLIDLL